MKRDIEDQLSGKAVVTEATAARNIRVAVKLFLANKAVEGIKPDVLGKYSRELGRLATYSEGKGVYAVAGLTVELLTLYAATWEKSYPSTQTRSVVRTRCWGFLRYCYEAQWLTRMPALPKITVDEPVTLPLDAEEYARLLEAAERFKAPPPAAQVRALVQLMRWSGLSITDALTLATDRITKTGGHYRVVTNRQKTGTHVSVVLPPAVGHEIMAVAGKDRIFWNGKQDIVKSWTKYVMVPLFKARRSNVAGR